MFRIQGPDIIEILRNSGFSASDKLGKIINDEIVVVSILGSSTYHEEKTHKRAFRLILDSFGAPSLFKDDSTPTSATDVTNNENSYAFANQDESKEEFPSDSQNSGQDGNENEASKEDDQPSGNDRASDLGLIDGFYTKDEQILFLHLHGAFDPKSLLVDWEQIKSDLKSQDMGFSQIWAKIKTKFCRSLLLLFSLSHVVLVSNTGNFFDTSYIQLFRILDTVRHEVLPHASKLLGKIEGIPKQWKDHGRVCSPRILFLFQVDSGQPLRISEELPLDDPIKDQQYKLEDEIYHILRKCRIVTNISANSLFAIPSTQEYVFIYDQGVQEPEMRDDPLSRLNHLTISFCEKMSTSFMDPAFSDYKNAAKLSFASTFPTIYSTNASKRLCDQRRTYRDVLTDFREFITSHTRLAHEAGFDDDSKHVAEHKHFFVLPTFKAWRKAFNALSNYLVLGNHSDHRARDALSLIYKFNNVDTEYLESQCAKVFPKVYALYLKNLPEIYPEKLHKAKVSHVVDAFLNVSRGPGVRPWVTKLIEKCDRYWKRGRQQCEARSLHEHTCSHALHRFRVEDHLEVIPLPVMDESLPEKEHNTGLRILSYCNCGHRQGSRDEPFTIREANYSFYERMAQDCCDHLERIDFPYFMPPSDCDKKQLDPQEMLLIYQQKLLGLLHHGNDKYEAVSDELEDELRQGPSLQFDENEEDEPEAAQQNQPTSTNQAEIQKEEKQEKNVEAVEAKTSSVEGKVKSASNIQASTPSSAGNLTPTSTIKVRQPEQEIIQSAWRKPLTIVEPDFLPRTELENEYIYKRIRERKALAETSELPESKQKSSAHPVNPNKKEVQKEIEIDSEKTTPEYQSEILQLSDTFKNNIKKCEEERKEWQRWSGYEQKSSNLSTSVSTNLKSVKETFYESFDLPMKTMALSMRFQPYWEQRSKRLPDHIVNWVNEYTQRRRFLFQDDSYSYAPAPSALESEFLGKETEAALLRRLSLELEQDDGVQLQQSSHEGSPSHFQVQPIVPLDESVPLETSIEPAIVGTAAVEDSANMALDEELGKLQSEESVAWLLEDSSDSISCTNDSEPQSILIATSTNDNVQEALNPEPIDIQTEVETGVVTPIQVDGKSLEAEFSQLTVRDNQVTETAALPNKLEPEIEVLEQNSKVAPSQDHGPTSGVLNVCQSDQEEDIVSDFGEHLPKPDENKISSRDEITTADADVKDKDKVKPEPDEETTPSTTQTRERGSETPAPVQEVHEDDTSIQYLPGMLHSRSLPGLLPLFSSWSLFCLGSSSLYTHTSGITHQPGFLTGSSTLLPWDKMVKAEAGVSKPIPRLIRGRKPTGRARRITDEFNVKVFIGVEYECKRGHRFFLESPDRILQTNMGSSNHGPPNLKEAANIVALSDMPLYYRCPCKESRDGSIMIAQLMRIHVITPKAPVHVTLNPRVQPGPSPCPIFYPGNTEPVKLTPSAYWMLRLPYCYVGDDQVYVPSRDVARYNGRLLKGLYDVESMSPDETHTWELQNSSIS